jgi:ATP-dependent protease ClpP protease subunit
MRSLIAKLSNNDIDKIRASVADSAPIYAMPAIVDDEIVLQMHGFVGEETDGLDAASLTGFLRANRGKPIKAYLNSMGGFVMDGIAIYNAIKEHDGDTYATIEGSAGSAMSIISQAFDEIAMHEASNFWIHRAWGVMVGNREDMLDMADRLASVDEMLFGIYKSRTGADDEQISNWMAGRVDGTSFNAKQAVEFGFADILIPNKTRDAATDVAPAVDEGLVNRAQSQARAVDAVRAAMIRSQLSDLGI